MDWQWYDEAGGGDWAGNDVGRCDDAAVGVIEREIGLCESDGAADEASCWDRRATRAGSTRREVARCDRRHEQAAGMAATIGASTETTSMTPRLPQSSLIINTVALVYVGQWSD